MNPNSQNILHTAVSKHIMNGGSSEDDLVNFAKTIDYMYSQLIITRRFCDDTGKNHIDDVLEIVDNIIR
jgi:hypothetical protein